MGYAAGQPTDGLDFLRLAQLILQVEAAAFILLFSRNIDHDTTPPAGLIIFAHHADPVLDPHHATILPEEAVA